MKAIYIGPPTSELSFGMTGTAHWEMLYPFQVWFFTPHGSEVHIMVESSHVKRV